MDTLPLVTLLNTSTNTDHICLPYNHAESPNYLCVPKLLQDHSLCFKMLYEEEELRRTPCQEIINKCTLSYGA